MSGNGGKSGGSKGAAKSTGSAVKSSGSGGSKGAAKNSGGNPKPTVGASGGKPNFYHDCLMYGVKPWDDEAPEFWHSLNRELAKAEAENAKK